MKKVKSDEIGGNVGDEGEGWNGGGSVGGNKERVRQKQ